VIQQFLSSWALFHNTYLAGWLISLLLSLIGVLVVARNQIFIGAAVSQAATLGIACGMWAGALFAADAGAFVRSDQFLSALAVAFSIMAAAATARAGDAGQDSHAAVTGWVFLASASFSILVLSHSPHGLEEVHRLLSSSIIGAAASDVWVFAALLLLTTLFIASNRPRIILFAMDPLMAAAVGTRTTLWEGLLSVWLGLVVGLSIRASGMLYTFGCLVLPALAAGNLCREVRSMFVVAPIIGLVTAVVGFVVADRYDFPPAQMTVALLGVLLPLAWLVRQVRTRRSI